MTSEGWKRWVRVRSQAGLARLSISNQLLVALARPDVTFVAGFNTWLRLGFAARKGERAVAIIAPLPVKERDRLTGEETGDTMMLFKTVFVFDRLSRVRSGGCHRRPGGEIRCLPVSRLCCSSAPASGRRGRLWPARSSRSRRPRATAQRRSRAPRRYPREQKRADQMPRMPPPCPHTGNLAHRRQAAEGCRLASNLRSERGSIGGDSFQPREHSPAADESDRLRSERKPPP